MNGSVRGAGFHGIFGGPSTEIRNVSFTGSTRFGINVGDYAIIEGCRVLSNNTAGGFGGISISSHGIVRDDLDIHAVAA